MDNKKLRKKIKSEFDWKFYVNFYPDINHVTSKIEAWKHYKTFGFFENRHHCKEPLKKEMKDNNFDWKFYVSQYPDLSHVTNKYVAWQHYLINGMKENRHKNGEYLKQNKEDKKVIEKNVYDENKPYVLVVMPTYNRSEYLLKSINDMKKQTLKKWKFLIIDDGSTIEHKKKFNEIKEAYNNVNKLIFMENDINCHIAKTLNKGIEYLLKNKEFTHFTWISDDNEYYPNFLSELVENNIYFKYTSYDIQELDGSKNTNIKSYKNFNDILNNFNGCAGFMWTREAINNIGLYDENIPGCEDFEYLLRTFKLNENECKFASNATMKYIRHKQSGFESDKEIILKRKENIIKNYRKSISIVMAYHNRKPQTIETLKGFEKMYSGKYNFEVVIVDDNSNEENRLEEDIKQFSFSIRLIVISKEEKGDRINPCIAYNKGFEKAEGDIIIIQNPECYHIDDILNDTTSYLTRNHIKTYSCYGLASFEQNNFINNPNKLKNKIKNINKIGGEDKSKDNLSISGWLNNKDVNPTYYHYCLSIHKVDLNILGGFSIDFRNGFCYDDDEFVRRAYYKNFKLEISDLLVIHQFHESSILKTVNKQKMHFNNFQIMKDKSIKMNISLEKQFIPYYYNSNNCSNIPKIAFSFWSGCDFSYLNLLSIDSFCFYNPEYKLILYTDMDFNHSVNDYKEFITNEQEKLNYNCNYFKYIYKLKEYYNIEIKVINKLNKKKCIILNTDYYRMYYLIEHGGIWVDLDILHLKPIDTLIMNKIDIFIHKYEYSNVITTGIIGSIKNHPKLRTIFNEMNNIILSNEKMIDYQQIGPSLITKFKYLFTEDEYIESTSFYPIEWYEINEYYEDNNFEINFYGVHWYNGSIYTKKYLDEFEVNFHNNKYINDKYCFMNKLIKKFLIEKTNKFSTDYVNFKFIPFSLFKNINIKRLLFKDKSLDEIAMLCEKNDNYFAFDSDKCVYITDKNIFDHEYELKEFININHIINGVYIKNKLNFNEYSDKLLLNDGIYTLNNVNLNKFEEKILYVTHKEEFKHGYGQLFRKDRLLSLENDHRFDCCDLNDNMYDTKYYYNKHKALITTHDCIRIEDKHPVDKTIHWCPHSMCGHKQNTKEWCVDSFKSYTNLLSLKTEEISHRLIILEDMHYYTFRGKTNDGFYTKGIDNLCNYIDKYYNFVIYHYENFELTEIKKKCKNVIKFYNLPHHVNTNIYKKYTEQKEYDVLFYGSCDINNYPLRYKIKNALLKSDLKYIILDKPNNWNELNDNVLDKLSRKINKAYITISCVAKTKYAVCKYFEIAASNSVVAGDACPIISKIFGDNMINLDISMSEDEIIKTLKFNLNNKQLLLDKSKKMYEIIQSEYNMKQYNSKLANIVDDCLKYNVKPFNKIYNNKMIQNECNGFKYVYLFYPNITDLFIIENNSYFFKITDNSLYLYKNNINKLKFIITNYNEIKVIKFLKTPENIYVYVNSKLLI
jgi:hypothetical protein